MAALHISVSQVKCYLRCPRQYELKYVRGVAAAFVPVALAFGSAFHAALSYFYGLVLATGVVPSLAEVTLVFTDAWRNAGDGDVPLQSDPEDEDEEVTIVAIEEKGVAMLAAFYSQAAASPVTVESVERVFTCDLYDPDTGELLEEKLVGAFDLVVREGDRRVVVEHKTSARRYSEDQLKCDLQPTAYKLAAHQLGLGDVGVRFQVVTKTKTPAVQVVDVERGDCDRDDFMRTAVGVLRAIDAQAFWPNRGWQCRGCQYAHACSGSGQ